jgi:hypothetical protein
MPSVKISIESAIVDLDFKKMTHYSMKDKAYEGSLENTASKHSSVHQ